MDEDCLIDVHVDCLPLSFNTFVWRCTLSLYEIVAVADELSERYLPMNPILPKFCLVW